MRFNLATIIASAGVLAFAATSAMALPAANGQGEYIVQAIEQDQFAVVFRGETGMDRREVAAAALRQAAQTAVDQGKEWFFVRETTTQRIDLSQVGSLEDLDRGSTAAQDTSRGAGGGEAGSRGSGTGVTFGADPSSVGLGTQAPSGLIERRPPRRVYQTVLLIQVGSGDEVRITGMSEAPEIFDAQALLTDE